VEIIYERKDRFGWCGDADCALDLQLVGFGGGKDEDGCDQHNDEAGDFYQHSPAPLP
jgi:hypothetical protein